MEIKNTIRESVKTVVDLAMVARLSKAEYLAVIDSIYGPFINEADWDTFIAYALAKYTADQGSIRESIVDMIIDAMLNKKED